MIGLLHHNIWIFHAKATPNVVQEETFQTEVFYAISLPTAKLSSIAASESSVWSEKRVNDGIRLSVAACLSGVGRWVGACCLLPEALLRGSCVRKTYTAALRCSSLGEGGLSRRDLVLPSGEVLVPSREVLIPSREPYPIRGDMRIPLGKEHIPWRDGEIPSGELKIP